MIRESAAILITAFLLTTAAVAQEKNSTAGQCGASGSSVAIFSDMQAPMHRDQHIVTSAALSPTLTMAARTASSEDITLIGDTLQIYRNAFNGRNLVGVKQAWPSVDSKRETKFREVFEFFRKDSLTPNLALHCAVPSVGGDQANVNCFQTLAYSDKKGKCHLVKPADVTIQMQRASENWFIQGMAARDHK